MQEQQQDTGARVVVLYGALRSGTTMIRLMFDGHPQLECPGERDFMLGHFSHGPSGLELGVQSLEDNRIFRESGIAVPEAREARAVFWDMVRQDLEGHDGKLLVLVLHRHLEDLLEVFPDVKIIHLVRDPRDVARSSIGMGWAGNTWFGVDHWLGTEHDWDLHSAKLTPEQVCLLQYEQLLEAPESELKRLCDFMGLPFDPAMLRFEETSSYSSVDPSLAYQWRRKQSPQELGEVEYKIGPLLAARGYPGSGTTPAAPNTRRAWGLWLQNKRHIWATRIQRFGLWDPLQVAVARRLGLPGLKRAAQRRIDEKTLAYLK